MVAVVVVVVLLLLKSLVLSLRVLQRWWVARRRGINVDDGLVEGIRRTGGLCESEAGTDIRVEDVLLPRPKQRLI